MSAFKAYWLRIAAEYRAWGQACDTPLMDWERRNYFRKAREILVLVHQL